MPPEQQPTNNNSMNVRPSVKPPAAVVAPLAAKLAQTLPNKPALESAEPVAESMVPPDETVWQKYAANGEPVISGLASFFVHVALPVIVVILGALLFGNRQTEPVEDLEPVEIGNGFEGGGGGSTEGVGNAPGNLSAPMDTVKSLDQDKQPDKTLPEDDPTIKKNTAPTIKDDDLAVAVQEKVKNKPNQANLGPVLKDALEGLAGKGLGGSGYGGGEGTGAGKGRGSGVGDGTGKTNRRGRRVLRWEMVFTVNSPKHYLDQLDALGAVIAVPDRTGKLMVIKNLKERPAKPQYEDVKAMNRIYWVDDRPETTRGIAEELQLDITPSALVAFFPQTLEDELLKKELAYRNKKEEDIKRTAFDIRFTGGKHSITVKEQDLFPGRK